MAKPSPESLLTKFCKLIPVKNDLGELQMPLRSDEIEDPPHNEVLPLEDRGTLWLDHKRVSDIDANLVEGNPFISAAFG